MYLTFCENAEVKATCQKRSSLWMQLPQSQNWQHLYTIMEIDIPYFKLPPTAYGSVNKRRTISE